MSQFIGDLEFPRITTTCLLRGTVIAVHIKEYNEKNYEVSTIKFHLYHQHLTSGQ
jgi:hypothetical protein